MVINLEKPVLGQVPVSDLVVLNKFGKLSRQFPRQIGAAVAIMLDFSRPDLASASLLGRVAFENSL
jgi:hypothetical protein